MNLLHQSAGEEREFHFWTGDTFHNNLKNGRLDSPRPPRSLLGVYGGDDTYTMSSPLLPHRKNCSSPFRSTWARTRAIEHGRSELMEMIRDLPESSLELSLKDIVVEGQKKLDEDAQKAEESSTKEKDSDPKEQMNKRRKKSSNISNPRVCEISRCSSMESGVFLIKLFPALLSWKKTSTKPTNQRKISPRRMSSLDVGSRVDLQSSKNCRSRSSSIIRSLSFSSRRKDGGEAGIHGCWPFEMMKPKIRRQKTCVF